MGSAAPAVPLTRQRPAIVTVLALLQFLGGSVLALGALALGLGAASDEEARMGLLIAAGIVGAIALVHLACGLGLWTLKGYGRVIQIVLAVLGLVAIPVGTIISILILVYLLKPGMKVLFSDTPVEQLSPGDTAELARVVRAEGGGAVVAVVAAVFVVLVLFIGIIAAIAVPNLLNAIQRGKQKRTMADLRVIATAVESYGIDTESYPVVDDIEALAAHLEPTYVAACPRTDGWARPYRYEAWATEDDYLGYGIASAGKDGEWEQRSLADYEPGATQRFDDDIVFGTGSFVRWPEGVQQ